MRPPTGHLPSQRQGVEGSSGNWQTSARGLDPARRASAGRLGSVTEHLTGPSSLPTEALLRPRLMLGSTASQSQADKVRATQTLRAKPPPGQAGQAQMGRGRQPGSAPLLAPSPRTLRVAPCTHQTPTRQAVCLGSGGNTRLAPLTSWSLGCGRGHGTGRRGAGGLVLRAPGGGGT